MQIYFTHYAIHYTTGFRVWGWYSRRVRGLIGLVVGYKPLSLL